MLASVQNTNSLSISNAKHNLLKDQTRLACFGLKTGQMKNIRDKSNWNGYHITTTSCCYNEMSTFQYRMLTFQGDQDFKTSTCQNIDTRKIHAAGGVNHST